MPRSSDSHRTGGPSRMLRSAIVLGLLLIRTEPAAAQLGPTELGPIPTPPTGEQAPRPRPPAGPPTSIATHGLKVEWLTFHLMIGGMAWEPVVSGGGELALITLTTRYFYWELVRLGGGMPLSFTFGTALGGVIHLDRQLKHELRIGANLMFIVMDPEIGFPVFIPQYSGVQLRYVWRRSRRLSLHVGLVQYTLRTGVMLTFGIGL